MIEREKNVSENGQMHKHRRNEWNGAQKTKRKINDGQKLNKINKEEIFYFKYRYVCVYVNCVSMMETNSRFKSNRNVRVCGEGKREELMMQVVFFSPYITRCDLCACSSNIIHLSDEWTCISHENNIIIRIQIYIASWFSLTATKQCWWASTWSNVSNRCCLSWSVRRLIFPLGPEQ